MSDSASNEIRTRDLWLQHATDALRPLFDSHGLPLPAEIRFAVAFTSTGRKVSATVRPGTRAPPLIGPMRYSCALI